MIHAKAVKPRIFPWNNAIAPAQIDRAQDIGGDLTLNREKQYEIGRDGILGYKQNTPSFSYSMRQFEYGDINFWRKIANIVDPASAGLDESVSLTDLSATKFDISAYLTDDDNTFRGTIWFPKLRVSGFSINIGDPDAIVERNFTFIGEDYRILDEKYFSYQTATVVAPGTEEITLSPAPIEFASGDYVFRVLRVRVGVVSELEEDATVTYDDNTWRYDNGTGKVYVQDCLASDIIKVYFPTSTAYTTLWTNNDASPDFLNAESCDIYMKVGTSTKIYRLQSVGLDVKFDRTDYKEIGNDEIVLTGTKSKTLTVSLDRFSEDVSLETILAGDTTYPYINPRDFADNIQLMVKVYEDKTKASFKIGYLIDNLSPTTMGTTQGIEDYNKRTNALESDNLLITPDEAECVFS